jgi:hypothetical protein
MENKMKVRIPKEILAPIMIVMGLIFVSAIFEQDSVIVGGICMFFVVSGVYFHFAVIKRDDHIDFDVIG